MVEHVAGRDPAPDLAGRDPVIDPALGFAELDLDRERRQGLAEVVYAPGKQPDQIAAIVCRLLESSDGPVLVSRIEPEAAAAVREALPGNAGGSPPRYHRSGRLLCWRGRDSHPGPADPAPADPAPVCTIAVVTAGTSDGPVADETAAVARAVGMRVVEIRDVGVAGLQRLLRRLPELAPADVVVVVAGMEGALASVVAGLVGVPVVAVPTSTGYGAALEGVTALLAMLSSCAAGVTVVNIDNGFGAAMAAHRLVFAMRRAAVP